MPATAIKATAMRANVVRFPSGREIKIDGARAAVELCQQEIFRSQLPYRIIADRSGIGEGTIGRLASGYTTRPAQETIARILIAVGWELIGREAKTR